MAMPESIGKSECANCGEVVHVKKNRGGFPYYRCEECGFEGRHHIARTGAKFMAERVKQKAQPAPEKAEKTEAETVVKKPEKPAPAKKEQSAAERFLLGV